MKIILVFIFTLLSSECAGQLIQNGDVNGDLNQDIGDVVYQLSYLFMAGPPPIEIPPYLPDMVLEDAQARFIDNANGTWSDTDTNLTWITGEGFISQLPQYGSYNDPAEYFNAIEYAGHSDWRLPTPQEMTTLQPWGCPIGFHSSKETAFGYDCSISFVPFLAEWMEIFGSGNVRLMLNYDFPPPIQDCDPSTCFYEFRLYSILTTSTTEYHGLGGQIFFGMYWKHEAGSGVNGIAVRESI